MKKTFFLATSFALASFIFSACGSNEPKEKKSSVEQTTSGDKYQCPMHPEEKSDKPAQCPKCGMDLEKIEPGTGSEK